MWRECLESVCEQRHCRLNVGSVSGNNFTVECVCEKFHSGVDVGRVCVNNVNVERMFGKCV